MRVVVIGAGIGGLACALSLEAAGYCDVQVFERAPQVAGLGVGINLLPHAMRELAELGLADQVGALGVAPATLAYFNRHGQLIWAEPRGLAAGYRWPQVSVHRGELQLTLHAAVRERLGDVVRTGHRLTHVTSGRDEDVAHFVTSDGPVDVAADLIVASDGIHSALRGQWFPEDPGPVWSGLTLWRGVARQDSFLDGRTMVMVGDGTQKFVAYPLGSPDADGTLRVNFIAERRGVGRPDADWDHAVDASAIAGLFEDWRYDWLDVPAMIKAGEQLLEYPMVDLEALPHWTHGRTTLLGDAAHAMYPNGSNGGSQAIIDARTLAFHLATSPTVAEAMTRYESVRRPVTTRLLGMTRQTGPEIVMQIAHQRAPEGFDDIESVIPATELAQIAADYKRVAGFHPDELNTRSSLTPVAR